MGGPNFNATVSGNGNPGVDGISPNGFGVQGTSTSGIAVRGRSIGGGAGVFGTSGSSTGYGVRGYSSSSSGVQGDSTSGVGVSGNSDTNNGVRGFSSSSSGVYGYSSTTSGVWGTSSGSPGMAGYSYANTGTGVEGTGNGIGVYGSSPNGVGVLAHGTSGIAVDSISTSGVAVYGRRKNPYDPNAPNSVAGFFDGGIRVINGPKAFTIDHPLDPENKYLVHACVESSEMKNVYDGVARLDEDGAAWVDLPEWFEALNGDLRYQLTAVGGSAPGLHVAEEVSENRFKIAGGEEGMKVCWQVTGTRKDPWAAANPFEVEQEKPEEERGRYLEPSLYDAPEEQRVMIGPMAEAVEEEQQPPAPSDIDFARLEEERRRQTDELRRLEEEQRREMEELRRRMDRQEEAPPEST
jgi:hypothetical protein